MKKEHPLQDFPVPSENNDLTDWHGRSSFDYISPLDTRYYGAEEEVYAAVHPYLSETATITYQLEVEQAIIASLEEAGSLLLGFPGGLQRLRL